MLGMITSAAAGLFSPSAAQSVARPAAPESPVPEAISAVESAAEKTTAGAGAATAAATSGTEATARAVAAPSDRSAPTRARTETPASAASGATASAAAPEAAAEDDIAAARAEAIATQESFKKSLLVASMSTETGESAPELGATPSRGAASYAAARSADAGASGSRSIAA